MSPVRLAYDLQALQVPGFADRGIGRYVAAMATAVARHGRLAAGLLAPDLPPPAGAPTDLATAGLLQWDLPARTRALAAAGPIVHHIGAAFLHCGPGDPDELVVSRHWSDAALPRSATIHDLIPMRAPSHYLPTDAAQERYAARARWVAGADLLLPTSEHVRREVIELLDVDPAKVVAVGAGVSPYFSPPDGTDGELFRAYVPGVEGRPFVLAVGGSDPRKNTERLIDAVGWLVRGGWDLRLVVVGDHDPHWRSRLDDAARSAWLGERLVLVGRTSDELLRACYRRASVLVMPSLAEGFGLPVLEAAACGCAALASGTSALAEAAATPAATFDPTSVDAIAAAIAHVLEDDAHRASILDAQAALAARSTWDAVAQRTIAALDRFEAAVPAHRWIARPAPPRLALVGPEPPDGGGLGTYNGRVLDALHTRVRVDAVTASIDRPQLPDGVAHIAADAFGPGTRPASYDAVVYTLGNSAGHLATAELALRHPGWLWLHEVRLPALATTALEARDDEGFERAMAWLLHQAYPGRAPLEAARRAGRSTLDLIDAGVGLTSLLVGRARGVLVNSEVARALLLLDLSPLGHHPPVCVMPPGCPPLDPSPRWSAPTDEPILVSLGVVSMAKRPDLVIDAVARVVAERPCRLVFVGPCPPVLVDTIADRARARGIGDRVEVTGAVDDETWRAWCQRAAIAVQLRSGASGETSAAVLESLARGLPVVTNMAVSSEYPPGTVALVDGSGPGPVAERLLSLLGDRPEQLRLARAGLDFAERHPFARLADAVVAATTGRG